METTKMCRACQSQMKATHVEYAYWHENELIALIQNVPAWVCQLCGHRYYDTAVETTLKYIVGDYIKLGKTFPIPSTTYRRSMS